MMISNKLIWQVNYPAIHMGSIHKLQRRRWLKTLAATSALGVSGLALPVRPGFEPVAFESVQYSV